MNIDLHPALGPLADDVHDVTIEVWRSLLGDEVPLVPRPVPVGTPLDAAGLWSASVTVSGGWTGLVTVEMAEDVARGLTRGMLGLPSETPAAEIGDGDVADAVGELANMVGGNVKSLMPGPSDLSLPSVAAGRAAFASDVTEAARVDLTWTGQPLRVSIHVPDVPPAASSPEEHLR